MDGIDTISMETPPRAWGNLEKMYGNQYDLRNTPTGVGKSVS